MIEDVPQPASDPYQLGDDVQIYVSETDPDSEYHEKEGTITDVLQDNLEDETGRELDFYSYRIKTNGEEKYVWFRHRDLVPVLQ
ncbi:hypothetical protein [Haladaptatus salinisoli]|uniref:hypothetical protein n=1 Tax=Haladaptatus salinisoli TaxID=2884876 RepID=UPI001D0A5D9A|nr:hypothetical protein [Haladaptatus salinisoli]